MPNFSQLFGGAGTVKSVQRGRTSPTQSSTLVTIAPVNPSKSMVNPLTFVNDGISSSIHMELVNSTTLKIDASIMTESTIYRVSTSWEVIEFY